jgi:hypothetical protein
LRRGFGLAPSFRVVGLLLLGLTNACSDDDPVESSTKAFWPLDFEAEFAEVRDCRLSPAEHDGYYIRVFASPSAETAYLLGRAPLDPGTQLVKGEYDDEDCSVLKRASGMLKLEPGTDPDRGDWIWQRADANGDIDTSTPARSCAGCHAACERRDYACTDP